MRIAIDLPVEPSAWQVAGGALHFAAGREDVEIVLPHAPTANAKDRDPASWDAAIVANSGEDLEIPTVCVSSAYSGDHVCVKISYSQVMRLAFDHFSSMGLVHFGFFSKPEWKLGWNVFSRRVREAGSHPVFISNEDTKQALMEIGKPCGIVTLNEELGGELLDTCKALGLNVPGDAHVISIKSSAESLVAYPTLSVISMPYSEVGFYAARMCADQIEGKPVKSITLAPSGLIIRESAMLVDQGLMTASEIANYLRVNLSYPIQMNDLVRRSGLSRRRLEQVFRDAYNASPIAFLKDLRLAHAKKMLRTCNAPLEEVADACGYANANQLCRAFRERVGVTPKTFRRAKR